jgi:hypothetical protein
MRSFVWLIQNARYASRWNSIVTNLTTTFPQLRKKSGIDV